MECKNAVKCAHPESDHQADYYDQSVKCARCECVRSLLVDQAFRDAEALSVQDARRYYLASLAATGVAVCTVCDTRGVVHERQFQRRQALALLMLQSLHSQYPAVEWFHYKRFVSGPDMRNYSSLKYWGLIESRPKIKERGLVERGKGSGWWKTTKLGLEVAWNIATIQKTVIVHNDKVVGFKGAEVAVTDFVEMEEYQKIMSEKKKRNAP